MPNSNNFFTILNRGLQSALASTPIENGKLRLTVDARRIFLDNDGKRIEFTDVIKDLTETQIRATLAPLDKLYLSSDTNKVMYWNNEWLVLCDPTNTTVFGSFDTFPRPGNPNTVYIDTTTDPNQMYTWNTEKSNYIIVGANGLLQGSMDVPLTIPAAGWIDNPGSTATTFKQDIEVAQIRKGHTPLYFMSDEHSESMANAFSMLAGYDTEFMKMTWYAVERPTVDISIILKGLPAQNLGVVDNSMMVIVEPEGFAFNPSHGRYEKTVEALGMTEGYGGQWDLVRSGEVITLEESKICCNITDVIRLKDAVKIVCIEPPTKRFVMCISGAYPNAEKGGILLGNMEKWLTKVENMNKFSYDEIEIGNWFGKPLYRKMVDFGELPSASNKSVAHNIADVHTIRVNCGNSVWFLPTIIGEEATVDEEESIDETSATEEYVGPLFDIGYSLIYQPFISHILVDKTEVCIVTNDVPAGYHAVLCIEYTKV